MSNDYATVCDRSFPAYHKSGMRARVRWIVLHDEEASTAESAARYFTSPASGGSAHLCVDDVMCFRCLMNNEIAWGAASSFDANMYGLHIEQAGFAKWSLAIWQRHTDTLKRAAYKTALHAVEFDVPPVFVTAAHLPDAAGITTHAEVSKASRRIDPRNAARYSHSDPGIFWPRRRFMGYVREFYADLTS